MPESNRLEFLRPYCGSLTPAQASEGVRAAIENARDLVVDAELLLERGRFARAAALAILAIEEAGKVPLIRTILAATSDAELKDAWKAYRDHRKKNVMADFAGVAVRSGKRGLQEFRIDDFAPLFENRVHAKAFDLVKQAGFYSECRPDATWSKPSDAISEGDARAFIRSAKLLCRDGHLSSYETERGLALWKEYATKRDSTPRVAFARCVFAMWQEGLISEQELTDMACFLGVTFNIPMTPAASQQG